MMLYLPLGKTLGMCLLLLLPALAVGAQEDDLAEIMRRGVALHQRGRYREAIIEYRKAAERDRIWSEPHRRIGLALRAMGKLEEAIEELRTAVRKDRRSAPAYNDLGVALAQKGQLEEAREQFQRALQIHPRMVEASFNHANLLYRLNRIEEAVGGLQETLRLDPNHVGAHQSLAVAYGRLGRWQEAVKSAERATQLSENNATLWLLLAWGQYKIGYTDRALNATRTAMLKEPNRAEGLYLTGFLFTAQRDLERAVNAYDQAVKQDRGRPLQQAIEDVRRELAVARQMPESYYILGMLLLANGKREDARKAFEAYLAQVSEGAWAQRARQTLATLN
jgi:tetratricopeptide (TPR) repeat protein